MYCGQFEILSRVGPMAYQLAFPPNFKIHNIFHISILKKYVHYATRVIDWNIIHVEPEGDFQVEPDCILDKREISPESHHWTSKGAMEAPYSI